MVDRPSICQELKTAESSEYEGLTIKMWEFVAKDLNLDYEYVVLNSTYDGVVQDVYTRFRSF